MRQLKALLLAAMALVFVAGVGTGAWIGTLAAAPRAPRSLDRRVEDFRRMLGLSPTQARQVREILADHDRKREEMRRPTPEQLALETGTRARIRTILTEEQRREYDRRTTPR
jgi:hypothetical protein